MNIAIRCNTFAHRTIYSLFIFFCVTSSYALAQYTVVLTSPNTIPSYCQETYKWCGPATVQMVLEGYPNGIEHRYAQSYLWDRVRAHANDPLANWSTDPDGLQLTLKELGSDPGVNWVIYSKPSKQDLTYSIMYWVAEKKFPAASLVDSGGDPNETLPTSNGSFQHWIVVTGFTSDVDPRTTLAVNLEYIDTIDPSRDPCPTNTTGGIVNTFSGSAWFDRFLDIPGFVAGSKWNNLLRLTEF